MNRLKSLYQNHIKPFANRPWSQEGEDMILRRLFGNRSSGFYVDIGAHQARRCSNTNYFYRQGWRDINIEPNPDGHALLKLFRRRDRNINCGVSDQEGTLPCYRFDEPALNTLDRDTAVRQSKKYRLIGEDRVRIARLEKILDDNMPADTVIDFINIDVEGHDLNVLKSNDWEKYRAEFVIAETIGNDMTQALGSDTAKFMAEQDYTLIAKTVNSVIFRDAHCAP